MRRSLLALLLAGFAVPAAAQDYPFLGQWDCQVATFTFDDTGYDNGTGYLPYAAVNQDGNGNWIIDLPDGAQIGLSSVTEDSLQWFSMASGDVFECRAIG